MYYKHLICTLPQGFINYTIENQDGGQNGRRTNTFQTFLRVSKFHLLKPHIDYIINTGFYTPKCLLKCVVYIFVCCSCDICETTSLFVIVSKMATRDIKIYGIPIVYSFYLWYILRCISYYSSSRSNATQMMSNEKTPFRSI